MRAKIENMSSRPDEVVIALAEFAASFFPHVTGSVPVTVKNTKLGRGSHGVCRGRRTCVIWIAREGFQKYPKVFEQMHYFRHANQDDVKPLTFADWKEELLGIIAHEMEHTTRGNRKMRRSRQEIHAWNREVEVVGEYRKPENQEKINARIEEIIAGRTKKIEQKEFQKTPDAKIIHIGKLMEKWQRKFKLAQTKIRKLKTRMKYYERKQAASGKEGAQ